jgi:hypothetical protein
VATSKIGQDLNDKVVLKLTKNYFNRKYAPKPFFFSAKKSEILG